jgi:hypothetical protein
MMGMPTRFRATDTAIPAATFPPDVCWVTLRCKCVRLKVQVASHLPPGGFRTLTPCHWSAGLTRLTANGTPYSTVLTVGISSPFPDRKRMLASYRDHCISCDPTSKTLRVLEPQDTNWPNELYALAK